MLREKQDQRSVQRIRLTTALSILAGLSLASLASCVGCSSLAKPKTVPLSSPAYERMGDEIMVAGQLFHTGAKVVLWTDPGGYDAYRVEKRFVPWEAASWTATIKDGKGLDTPNRYGTRAALLSPEDLERVRGGGWDLETLQGVVDQFVLHYDVCGTSRQCFKVLHDLRGLSVHFMIDLDGTIYQTLDLKERAWHATTSNDRSVGVEIANMGSYPDESKDPFDKWYELDESGNVKRITIPSSMGDGGILTPNFVGVPIRPQLVRGEIHGVQHRQYDLTPQQYEALIKLTATLCTVLPKIRCDHPKDENGNHITTKLPDEVLKNYTGLIGHYHIQSNKADPGPAFQWEYVTSQARQRMAEGIRK